MDHILTSYEIDRTRVVVHGYEAGGTLAYWVAFSHLDIVRAVAAIDTSLPSQLRPPATDPLHRLSILATTSSTSPAAMRINQSLKVLALLKYPLFVHDRNKNEGVFNSTEQAMLVRWIDALDRI
jgi:poly(3-hydroxybutyrate) depolymerase